MLRDVNLNDSRFSNLVWKDLIEEIAVGKFNFYIAANGVLNEYKMVSVNSVDLGIIVDDFDVQLLKENINSKVDFKRLEEKINRIIEGKVVLEEWVKLF